MPSNNLYGFPQPLTQVFPSPILAQRAPLTTDFQYQIGQVWVNEVGNDAYILVDVTANSATWQIMAVTPGEVATITASSGGALSPTAGNINILGTANQITTAGAGSTVTLTLPAAITAPGSLTTTTTLASGTTLAAGTSMSSGTSIMAGTTVTAGTGLIATTGGVTATAGDILASDGDIITTRSDAGADVTIEATNSDNTNGASRAGVEIATGGASSGDPFLSFQISGVGASTMTIGLDNSASDIFVISNSTAIGTSNALTLSQAGALTATTSITATLGAITATNGNLVLTAAGNKMIRSSVGSTSAAGANSIGSVTLVGGTVTVSTTAVTTNSLIQIWRQSVGATGAAALGNLSVGTIVNGTSFVINAWQAADATALQASDVSVIGWEIIN